MKTGMLHDEATIRVIASTLREYYTGKPLRLVCYPVCVSTSGHALFIENSLGSLIDEIIPLAVLITPNKSEAELILSHKQKVLTSALADMVSVSRELLNLGLKAVLLKGGHVTTTMTEVHELLETNPAVSLYKYGLLDENILQVGCSEEDRISRLVFDILQDWCGSGGAVETSIFIRPRIETTSTHGTGCTLSAAILCGLASGSTSNLSPLFAFLRADRRCLAPESVRNGTIYTHLGVLHPFPVGTGHGSLNYTHSVVSRSVPRCVGLLRPKPYPNLSVDLTGDRHPLICALILSTTPIWKVYVEHTFVKELGKRLLDKRCFVHFIKYVERADHTPWSDNPRRQDYHYLKYYPRASAWVSRDPPRRKFIQWIPQVTGREVNRPYGHGRRNAADSKCLARGFNEPQGALYSVGSRRERAGRNSRIHGNDCIRSLYNGYWVPR